MSKDFLQALRLVWAVVALATAAAVAAPLLLPADTITGLVPVCESKRLYGRECFLCGATTGFLAIAHGDFATAAQSNRLAIPLYVAFSMNSIAAIAYFTKRKHFPRNAPAGVQRRVG